MSLSRREAWWTCDDTVEAGPLYYVGLSARQPPPYLKQRHVTAILDIADDGTLAGIELVHGDLPPPPTQPDQEHSDER